MLHTVINMILIKFAKSNSSRYKEAIKLALFLGKIEQKEVNYLRLEMKTIIEKWEYFNEFYWLIINWAKTTVTYGQFTYFSQKDKSQIFYAIQQIHTNWINCTTTNIIQEHNILNTSNLIESAIDENLDSEQANRLIDIMEKKKKAELDFMRHSYKLEDEIINNKCELSHYEV